jgi:hypothetical protein
MPNMNGVELVTQFRALDPDVALILISAFDMKELGIKLALYSDKIEIPELEAKIRLDNINEVRALKGSETMLMIGIVGLIIDKDKSSYVVIELRPSKTDATQKPASTFDGLLLEFEHDVAASEFVKEVKIRVL